jgi:hypothetical protein
VDNDNWREKANQLACIDDRSQEEYEVARKVILVRGELNEALQELKNAEESVKGVLTTLEQLLLRQSELAARHLR